MNASYKKKVFLLLPVITLTLHPCSPSFSDVSLVCCFLPRTQSPRSTYLRRTGYQYTDVGVRGNGKAHWTHSFGEGKWGPAAPSQLFFHSGLQLVSQQPDPTALWADTQRPTGTAGPLYQDPTCQVWTLDCQVRKTDGYRNIVGANWQTNRTKSIYRYNRRAWWGFQSNPI